MLLSSLSCSFDMLTSIGRCFIVLAGASPHFPSLLYFSFSIPLFSSSFVSSFPLLFPPICFCPRLRAYHESSRFADVMNFSARWFCMTCLHLFFLLLSFFPFLFSLCRNRATQPIFACLPYRVVLDSLCAVCHRHHLRISH